VRKNELLEISSGSACSTDERSQLIRKALAVFGENYREEVSAELSKIWDQALADIPTEQLTVAFDLVLKTCRRFPSVADVRAQVAQADEYAFSLEAEEAWQRALDFITQGCWSRVKELDGKTMHAVRAAGGSEWIESCSREDLQWAKKRFIADYTLIHEMGQAERLLSDGEAKRLLRELNSRAKGPRALPAVGESAEP
jgi:hypothetical protein